MILEAGSSKTDRKKSVSNCMQIFFCCIAMTDLGRGVMFFAKNGPALQDFLSGAKSINRSVPTAGELNLKEMPLQTVVKEGDLTPSSVEDMWGCDIACRLPSSKVLLSLCLFNFFLQDQPAPKTEPAPKRKSALKRPAAALADAAGSFTEYICPPFLACFDFASAYKAACLIRWWSSGRRVRSGPGEFGDS